MPPSFPNDCLSDVLSFLGRKSLYRCLFVNRLYCKLSIPIIWRDPFIMISPFDTKSPLINTLLACLNEDEISSLIPCAIKFINQPPLFGYGKFIRKIDHGNLLNHILSWLKLSNESEPTQDCRVQKLINVIYHMIMRQGSNLHEFVVVQDAHNYIDLPKFSVFTTYKPGITNLRSFNIDVNFRFRDKLQNTIEFLSTVSNFCNRIDNYELSIDYGFPCTALLDFIKLQPLKRMVCSSFNDNLDRGKVKKIIHALEFRSKTLKELSFDNWNFQGIDLSFLSKLEYLEHLEFQYCVGFTLYEDLSKKKLNLKALRVWYCDMKIDMINSLCSEALVKLSLTDATLEIIKIVKESCPRISHLLIKVSRYLDSIIPLICELSSLRILNIYDDINIPVRLLGDYLTSVEYLFLDSYIYLPNFEYFTNNCKANLKKLIITLYNKRLRIDYLKCVNNFQKAHNSLKVLGIKQYYEIDGWTNEELEIIDSLKNQGIDIVTSDVVEEFHSLLKLFV